MATLEKDAETLKMEVTGGGGGGGGKKAAAAGKEAAAAGKAALKGIRGYGFVYKSFPWVWPHLILFLLVFISLILLFVSDTPQTSLTTMWWVAGIIFILYVIVFFFYAGKAERAAAEAEAAAKVGDGATEAESDLVSRFGQVFPDAPTKPPTTADTT